ncbi:hypothetical protein CF123_18150 [Aeromonas veronii]|uniref:HTH cro/C1-type domain-containing protein n=2 Tax=Aeromonas veronii TaxID=654 RepID=A0AAX2UPF4_AERVE|nr:hypothetical protein CF123_18150 [Aeromonas veronii]
MSYLAFADKCGLTESGVRKYFPPFSSDPTLSRALAIANACGVSLEWLATGATTIPVSCGAELVESVRHLQNMADSQWSLSDETRGHLRRAARAIVGEGEGHAFNEPEGA